MPHTVPSGQDSPLDMQRSPGMQDAGLQRRSDVMSSIPRLNSQSVALLRRIATHGEDVVLLRQGAWQRLQDYGPDAVPVETITITDAVGLLALVDAGAINLIVEVTGQGQHAITQLFPALDGPWKA